MAWMLVKPGRDHSAKRERLARLEVRITDWLVSSLTKLTAQKQIHRFSARRGRPRSSAG